MNNSCIYAGYKRQSRNNPSLALHKYVNFFDIALFDIIASVMGIVRFGMGI